MAVWTDAEINRKATKRQAKHIQRSYTARAEGGNSLSGEELLVIAFLRLMVMDARRPGQYHAKNGTVTNDPEEARAFIRDTERLGVWCDLLNLNTQKIQERLLREAGMEP